MKIKLVPLFSRKVSIGEFSRFDGRKIKFLGQPKDGFCWVAFY